MANVGGCWASTGEAVAPGRVDLEQLGPGRENPGWVGQRRCCSSWELAERWHREDSGCKLGASGPHSWGRGGSKRVTQAPHQSFAGSPVGAGPALQGPHSAAVAAVY